MNGVRRLVFNLFNTKVVFVMILLTLLAGLFGFVFMNPHPAQAETQDSDITLSINSALALSLTNCDSEGQLDTSINNQVINLSIIPTPEGLFKSTCQTLTVNANTPGYTLTAKSSSTDLTYLNPRDTTLIPETPIIPSTTSLPASPSTLSNNEWGFAVEDRLNFDNNYTINSQSNNYAALPTTDITIYETDQFPLPITNHKFFYGTQLDTTTLAGTYGTTITYTAIGEDVPEPPKNLKTLVADENITTMQTMTSALCASAKYDGTNNGNNANNTAVLTDTRNNQEYRIRKLADNKCWMIDNLKLATPGTALTLTSADTNIAEGTTFTIPPNAVTTVANRITNGTCVGGVASGTTGVLTCDGAGTESDSNLSFIAYVDPSDTTNCANNIATNGDINAYSLDSQTGCGYLYNWYTATAGTGIFSIAAGDAEASICPVNWKLPSADTGGATNSNEFAVLNGAMINDGPSIVNDNTTRLNWQTSGQFSSTYAGTWFVDFLYQGSNSYYWSSSVGNNIFARDSYFDFESILPGSNADTKYNGLSIRCVL